MALTNWTTRSTPVQKTIDLQSLCLSLVKAETEESVIDILKKADLWDNERNWKNYGNTENNFSVIGSQQSRPEAAIVEKIINSVDAMLMRECLRRKINPESSHAPENIVDALEQFFHISQECLRGNQESQRKYQQDGDLHAHG
jgi:hypothetical protein